LETPILRAIEAARREEREAADTTYEEFKKSSEGNRLRLEYEERILAVEERVAEAESRLIARKEETDALIKAAEAEVERLKGYMTPGGIEAEAHVKDLLRRWKAAEAEVERLRAENERLRENKDKAVDAYEALWDEM
jgi:chromosome segregation ATPase